MPLVRVENPFTDTSLAEAIWDWGWPGNRRCWWWVVYDKQGRWVAFGGLSVFDRDTLYCGPSFVRPEARGQGLQLSLLKARIAFAREWGARRVVSVVNQDNSHSMRNLLKAGFVQIEAWEQAHGLCFALTLGEANGTNESRS